MLKNKLSLISLLIILFLPIYVYAQSEEEYSSEDEYVLSAGDLIQISVYEEPDLSAQVRISEDGTIKLPLLESLRAGGLTIRELEGKITALLAKDFLVDPQVSVFVQEYAKIFIMGRVNNAGSHELKGRLTLTSAIAMAGGFSDTADTSRVKLIRSIEGVRETQEINIEDITNNLIPDVELYPNDTVVVEELGRISIIGQVNSPGTYDLKKDLTLLEAVGMAGGFTNIAAIDGTSVIRVEHGKKKIIRVRVSDITKRGDKSKDIILKAGDTIVVPESFF